MFFVHNSADVIPEDKANACKHTKILAVGNRVLGDQGNAVADSQDVVMSRGLTGVPTIIRAFRLIWLSVTVFLRVGEETHTINGWLL